MAEHGTPDLSSSRIPFIQALVQKSVTAITNAAGRLSISMLRERLVGAQGGRRGAAPVVGRTSHREAYGCERCAKEMPRKRARGAGGRDEVAVSAALLLLTGGRNKAVHAQVYNHLSVMVHDMGRREAGKTQT